MERARPSTLFKTIQLLSIFLGVGIPMMTGLCAFLLSTAAFPQSEASPWVLHVLIVIMIANPLVAFFILKKVMLKPKVIASVTSRRNSSAGAQITNTYVGMITLAVSPSSMGLIAYILGWSIAFPFAGTAISVVFYAFMRPRDQEFENLLREVERLQQVSASPNA